MKRFLLAVNLALAMGGAASAQKNDQMEVFISEFMRDPKKVPVTLEEAGAALVVCFMNEAKTWDQQNWGTETIVRAMMWGCDKQRNNMARFVAKFNNIEIPELLFEQMQTMAMIKEKRRQQEMDLASQMLLAKRRGIFN